MKTLSFVRVVLSLVLLLLLQVLSAQAQMLERELAEPRVRPTASALAQPEASLAPEQRRDQLVRTLANTLQLQPHQTLLLRQALTDDLNLAPFPDLYSPELVQIPYPEQLRLLLSATQLNRLREWELTAPEARQLSFIALER
ncbi:hypothetical protein E5K00_07195 [Hymenobacter aquaticus]|uniref:DUF3300 domain-containing protein n=1 Tax=Hymenobacter aquaticus TaxID=1867101 RepID=A0A4Z0Q6D6_9BACT|nr:hypothetical protein [Hymenobacter aquaticus]TGE24979.1 hypothetical protein E5K00_07195 [Hymenobacter aquaticus]